MTAIRGTRKFVDRFDRAQTLSTTPGHNGWTIKDTSAAGSPTYLTTAAGMVLTMASNSEAEILTMYQNDVLIYNINNLDYIWWTLSVAGVDAVTTLSAGVGSAENDTPDSVTTSAWISLQGSDSTSNLVVETDDNVNDNNDIATGTTLGSTLKKLMIDFTQGLKDVRFYIDGARVAAGTTFDMSNCSSTQGVQPYLQLQKASGTGVGAVTVREFGAQFTYADGA